MKLFYPTPPQTPPSSDLDLLRRCQDGDQLAWENLIHRYRNLIFSIPIRMGLSQDDANEVFQETCLALLGELSRIREPKALAAWLIKVTLSKCARFRRKNARLPLDLTPEAIDTLVSPDNPSSLLNELQRIQILRDSVLELASRCRTLIERLFLTVPPEPYETVAQTLGIPKGSIGFNRNRCLTQLRQRLEERGF